MRKRVLLAVLGSLILAVAFVRLGGPQQLRDRLRRSEVLRAFAVETSACLADRRTGRPIEPWTHENLAATIHELGRLRVDAAVPDLALLLDNDILPNACIDALGAIADDRALFALAGRALSTNGLAGADEAGAHLRRIAVPIYPILTRALSAPDPLLRRRAAILLARLPSMLHRVSASIDAGAARFEVPPDGAAALLPRLHDASPQARFDAVRAYLSLGGDPRLARSILADESNLSIRDLLDGALGATASRARPIRFSLDSSSYFAVRAVAAHRYPRPTEADYRHVSEWRAFRDDLEIRVSTPDTMLTLPEPQFELNRPVWIRAEIRNPGPRPRRVRGTGSEAPFVTLWLRDAYGHFERIRGAEAVPVADRIAERGTTAVTLEPGDVARVELNLLRGLSQLRFNGEYGIAVSAKGEEPPLLELLIRGLPEPPWLSQKPGPLGIDPSKIYFENVDLTLPPARAGPRAPQTTSSPPRRDDSEVAEETQTLLRSFLETRDRRRLYDLTRRLSAREISISLQQLAATITPSSRLKPRLLIDRPAIEPNDELVRLRAVRAGAATFHLVVERQFTVPIPDRLGGQRRWMGQILHATFRAGRSTEPEVVCESCSDPHPALAADGTLWLVTAGNGLTARHLSRERAWSPAESILDETPRRLRGFDATLDGQGNPWVVWEAWNGDDRPATFRWRVRTSTGWQPGESRPLPRGLSVRNPQARWLNGGLCIFATIQEKPAGPSRIGLFARRKEGRLDYRRLDAKGWDLDSAPPGEPLLFASHSYAAAETVELGEIQAVGMTPKRRVVELGSLAAPEGDYRGLGLAADRDAQPLVLVGWHGHALLLRRPGPGRTQAALLALASKSDVVDAGGSPKPPMIGTPQLFVSGDRFVAFWLETRWRMEGSQPRPRESRLWYLSGSLSQLDWREVTELAVALRPTTGLLRSDLGFLERTALAEARAADEKGDRLSAMERFVWLIEASRDLGGVLDRDRAGVPSTWIQGRFRAGDAAVRQRLWELAAERPLLVASDASLLALLADEIAPQERVERAKARTQSP